MSVPRLFLSVHRRVPKAVRVDPSPPSKDGNWSVAWSSPELRKKEIAEIRDLVSREWQGMEISPGVYLADPAALLVVLERRVMDRSPGGPEIVGWPAWYSRKRIHDPGFVYVLTNPAMPGLVKIGRSARSVRERIRELNATGVPRPFEAYWVSGLLANHGDAEREIHRALSSVRVSGDREFFRVDPVEVVEFCKAVTRDFVPALPPRAIIADLFEWIQRHMDVEGLAVETVLPFLAALADAEDLEPYQTEVLEFFLERLRRAEEDDVA